VAALTNPPALVELFAETIVEELDFRLEARTCWTRRGLRRTGQRPWSCRAHPELVTVGCWSWNTCTASLERRRRHA